ncbi:MAG: aminoglycoside phosphotransferase family protein [Mesorhizobium sp.]|uniref:phosphotransferase family protein n=1 Tax=Mesorhizobium sp. TaxID=1871066 RepID=UPI001ACE221E|nr:aminoglycoside phosphotransferase family protein [Mesorhizobium sp.]MBN9221623.1 aminoglycoside phosphotransferase family protein [Mesorhizobium sp.]
MTKSDISLPEIKSRLESRFGGISEFQRISEGEESRALGFKNTGGDYIVRINRSAAGFEKDRFVFQRFSNAELPVPEIVSIDLLAEDLACCVSRRAAGVTLQDLPVHDLQSVLEPVSRILDAMTNTDIHETDGFGPFDTAGSGGFGSWRDFLMSIDDRRRYDWGAASRYADTDRVKRIIGQMQTLAADCPEIRRLVHGDFGSNNVVTDQARITGVIDWSEAMFGDPLYDVANILFWRPWLDCMEQQARFFETRQPNRLRYRRRLACYQLRIGLQTLYEAAIDGNNEETVWALTRSESIASGT